MGRRRVRGRRGCASVPDITRVSPRGAGVMHEGRDSDVAPFASARKIAYGFLAVVSLIAVSIFMAVSILIAVSAGAGAIAGAAVVSTGVSSFVVHAARASTAATRARRFIYILLEGGVINGCRGPRSRYQDRGQNLRARTR